METQNHIIVGNDQRSGANMRLDFGCVKWLGLCPATSGISGFVERLGAKTNTGYDQTQIAQKNTYSEQRETKRVPPGRDNRITNDEVNRLEARQSEDGLASPGG